jgi:hypothetical protein
MEQTGNTDLQLDFIFYMTILFQGIVQSTAMCCVGDCCRISERVIFGEDFPSFEDTRSRIDEGSVSCISWISIAKWYIDKGGAVRCGYHDEQEER